MKTRLPLSSTSMARIRRGSCVATPTGHSFVWHFCAWMHPVAIIIARADMVKSAPWIRRLTMSEPVATLPAAPSLIMWRRPVPTSALCTSMRPSVSGVPTRSEYSSGAAPVPPSEPSTMMKSGAIRSSQMALVMASTSTREPTQNLMPIGLPSESSRSCSMNLTISRGVRNAEWDAGDRQSLSIGISRASAISAEIFSLGSMPPRPGFAPWEILMVMPLTSGSSAFSANFSGLKVPSSLRQPK